MPQIADSRSGANLDRGEQPATAAELLAAAKDLYGRRQLPLALQIVDQALAREPGNVDAWNAKGVFLRDSGQTTKSISCYQQALKLNHASGEIWSNLGNSLKDLKQLDRAVAAHHQAVKLRPDNPLAWHNLGITLVAANRVDEALTAFNRALLIRPGDPHIRWDRGLTLLQRGDLAAGWVDYEARFENGLLPNRPLPGQRWALQPYRSQRLLITAEQGFGDTIWAARFLERAKALGGQLILECQKELKPLLEPLGFVDEFIDKGAPLPAADWHSSICSLPGLFTPSLAQVSGLPYLAAKSGGMGHLRPLLARAEGRLRVGIVWSGTATYNLNGGVLQVGGVSPIIGSGAFNLGGGTLQVSGAPLTLVRPISLTGGSSSIDTNGQTAALGGVISGPGGLVKAGQGTLILTAANSYTGGTLISGGILQIGNGGTTGSITGNVINNGILAFDRLDNIVFTGAISGTGIIQQETAASVTLMTPSVYSGATTVNIGTLRAGGTNVLSPNSAYTVSPGATLDLGGFNNVIGSLAGSGAVTLGTATLTSGADGTSTSYAGAITGIGGVTKIGGGTLVLTGANRYTGATSIAAGTLQVDGSITSPATVQSGAILRGTGTIFGDVQNNSVIAPGDASSGSSGVGTLMIAGNYADPGGNVTVRTVINAGGPGNQITDRLLISGNAVGTTSVTVQPIGKPTGALTGNTPTSGISIIQVGGTASPASFSLNGLYVASGPYQVRLASFAHGASAASEVDPRLQALGITSVVDYRLQTAIVPVGDVGPNGEAVGQPIVLPQVATYRALPTAGLMYGQALADDLHRRLGDTEATGLPSTQMAAETFVRLKGWTGNVAGAQGRPAFDQALWFMQAGLGVVQPSLLADGDRLHVDAVISSGGSDVTLTSNRSKLHFDTTSVGGTATYQAPSGWYLDAVLLGNFYSNTHVGTQQTNQIGSTMGTGLVASLEAGYPIPVGLGVVLEPRASVTFQSLSFNDFTDAAGLTFHQTDTQSAVGRIGARVLRTYDLATPIPARVAPFLSVDVSNDFIGAGREQVAGVNFSTSPLGTAMRAGGGVNAQVGKIAAYVDVGRTVGLGNGSATGWDGIAGAKIQF